MNIKTLQKLVYKDNQYILYYLKRNKLCLQEYEDFCSTSINSEHDEYINTVWEDMSIDLLPYLYTINNILNVEFNSLLIYVIQYASSVDIDIMKIREYIINNKKFSNNINNFNNDNINVFIDMIKHDKVLMVILISVMQYYFI
jgi:hypothetical protein